MLSLKYTSFKRILTKVSCGFSLIFSLSVCRYMTALYCFKFQNGAQYVHLWWYLGPMEYISWWSDTPCLQLGPGFADVRRCLGWKRRCLYPLLYVLSPRFLVYTRHMLGPMPVTCCHDYVSDVELLPVYLHCPSRVWHGKNRILHSFKKKIALTIKTSWLAIYLTK